jgi:hypothetical protein
VAQAVEHAFNGEQRSLGVEGVENGFHHQQVRAAFRESQRGLGVAVAQLGESNVPVIRAVDVG